MSNWQSNLPEFKPGERLSAAKLNQLAENIAAILRGRYGVGVTKPLNIIGKLDGELAAATAFATAPATATLSVWIRNVDGDLEDSGRNETIVNRFEFGTPIAAGTIMKAEWIEGEWQPYAADCEDPG